MASNDIKKEKTAESICRLCFVERENYQMIFIDDYCPLNEWIENLTTLKISNVPNAPASLCSECENTLQNFESFREMCFTNDRVFNEMFNQDDPVKDQNAVSDNTLEENKVKLDCSENQETDFVDTTIAQIDNTEIKIEYPDIKTEVSSSLNLEENNDEEKAENESTPDTEGVHRHKENKSITKAVITEEGRHPSTYYTEENQSSRDLEHVQQYGKSASLLAPATAYSDKYKRKHCNICNKFVLRLTQHQFIHNKIRPYKCEYCSKGFILKSKLTLHIRRHTKEKPFVCSQCGKGFTNSSSLKIHIRSHTQERPFKCKNCSKAFITAGHLLRHMHTHSGIKPFSCDICEAHFSQKTYLVRHKRVHGKVV